MGDGDSAMDSVAFFMVVLRWPDSGWRQLARAAELSGHGRKIAVRHTGSCAPGWCFPPRFSHRLEEFPHVHHRTI